jgi:hypothetical protein
VGKAQLPGVRLRRTEAIVFAAAEMAAFQKNSKQQTNNNKHNNNRHKRQRTARRPSRDLSAAYSSR